MIRTFMSKLSVLERSLAYVGVIGAAMAEGHLLEFNYDDKHRLVEPHAVGRSTKDGSIVLRAYQIGGDSSRPLPAWVLFSVDKIERISVVPGHSEAPREGYALGDKQMDPVLVELGKPEPSEIEF